MNLFRYYQQGGEMQPQVIDQYAQPQQPQQAQVDSQLMEMFSMYFQMMQMSEQEIQQFMSEFQSLSPQEQEQVVAYIQQQLSQGQSQQPMEQQVPQMQQGGYFRPKFEYRPIRYQVGGYDVSDMDTNESLMQQYPAPNYVAPNMTAQTVMNTPITNVKPISLQPIETVSRDKTPYSKDGYSYFYDDNSGQWVGIQQGHSEVANNPLPKTSIKKSNELVQKADADLTPKQRSLRDNASADVRKLQQEIEEVVKIGTGKQGKKGVYDGVFGEQTAEGAKKLYAVKNGKEGSDKEVTEWLNTWFKNVTVPKKYFTGLTDSYKYYDSLGNEVSKSDPLFNDIQPTRKKVTQLYDENGMPVEAENNYLKEGKIPNKITSSSDTTKPISKPALQSNDDLNIYNKPLYDKPSGYKANEYITTTIVNKKGDKIPITDKFISVGKHNTNIFGFSNNNKFSKYYQDREIIYDPIEDRVLGRRWDGTYTMMDDYMKLPEADTNIVSQIQKLKKDRQRKLKDVYGGDIKKLRQSYANDKTSDYEL